MDNSVSHERIGIFLYWQYPLEKLYSAEICGMIPTAIPSDGYSRMNMREITEFVYGTFFCISGGTESQHTDSDG